MVQQCHSWANIQTELSLEKTHAPQGSEQHYSQQSGPGNNSGVQWRMSGRGGCGTHTHRRATPCAATGVQPEATRQGRQAGGTPPGPLHVRPEPPQRGLFMEETQDRASSGFSAAAKRKGGAEGLDWEARTSGASCYTRDGQQRGLTLQRREPHAQHPTINHNGEEHEKEYGVQLSHMLYRRSQSNTVNQLFFNKKQLWVSDLILCVTTSPNPSFCRQTFSRHHHQPQKAMFSPQNALGISAKGQFTLKVKINVWAF